MSSALHDSRIHTIQVSVNLNDKPMTFTVGKTANIGENRFTYSRIERNENYLHISGNVIYEVFGRDESGVEHRLKFFENLPVYVSLFTNIDSKQDEI